MNGVVVRWDAKSKSGMIFSDVGQTEFEPGVWFFSSNNAAQFNRHAFDEGCRVTFNASGQCAAVNVFVTEPDYTAVDLRGALSRFKHLAKFNDEIKDEETASPMSIDDSNSLKPLSKPPTDDNSVSDRKSNIDTFVVPTGLITARDLTRNTVIAKNYKNGHQIELVVVKENFFGGNIVCYAYENMNELKGGYDRYELTNNHVLLYNAHVREGTVNTQFVFLKANEVKKRGPKLKVFWRWWDELLKEKRKQKLMISAQRKENKTKYGEQLQLLKAVYSRGTWSDTFLLSLLGKYNGDCYLVQADDGFKSKNGLN